MPQPPDGVDDGAAKEGGGSAARWRGRVPERHLNLPRTWFPDPLCFLYASLYPNVVDANKCGEGSGVCGTQVVAGGAGGAGGPITQQCPDHRTRNN